MQYMSQFSVDLVTFTEETLNGRLHFFCSELMRRSFKVAEVNWTASSLQILSLKSLNSSFSNTLSLRNCTSEEHFKSFYSN